MMEDDDLHLTFAARSYRVGTACLFIAGFGRNLSQRAETGTWRVHRRNRVNQKSIITGEIGKDGLITFPAPIKPGKYQLEVTARGHRQCATVRVDFTVELF